MPTTERRRPPAPPRAARFSSRATTARAVTEPRFSRPPAEERPTRDRPRGWRSDVVVASALELLVGGWLVAAPFVLGYGWTAATWDDVIVGALVAVLAVGRLARPARSPELSWVATLLGLWLFTWAFWADRGATAMWNDAVAGGLVAVFALVSASASEPAPVDPAEER